MLHIDQVCDRPGLLALGAALSVALSVGTPVNEHGSLPLRDCMGRITPAPTTSAIPLPPFDQSAVALMSSRNFSRDGGIVRYSMISGSTRLRRIMASTFREVPQSGLW